MLRPVIRAWIEERGLLLRGRVEDSQLVRLAAVAVEAGEREIIERIRAALDCRQQMIDREPDVLPTFIRVAVFA